MKRRPRRSSPLPNTPITRACAQILGGLTDLSIALLGEYETENLILKALDLPPKKRGESHAAWRKRCKIK